MNTWKYTRRRPKKAKAKLDDSNCLQHHHKGVLSKAKAKDAKQCVREDKQAVIYQEGRALIYSGQTPPKASKWVRGKFWFANREVGL